MVVNDQPSQLASNRQQCCSMGALLMCHQGAVVFCFGFFFSNIHESPGLNPGDLLRTSEPPSGPPSPMPLTPWMHHNRTA